jgi:hypothetical protein
MSAQIFGRKPPLRKKEPGLVTRAKVGQQLPNSGYRYYHKRLSEQRSIQLASLQSMSLCLRSPGICFANSFQQKKPDCRRPIGDYLVQVRRRKPKNSGYTGVSADLRPAIHPCRWGQNFQTRIWIFAALKTCLIPNAAKETK